MEQLAHSRDCPPLRRIIWRTFRDHGSKLRCDRGTRERDCENTEARVRG